ncbi:MAG: MipA/OmpV family protein, partial [Gammaproteobacteria bacterium]|nr:MipA/OmpV family protein [Gammaproteobacteria bacterium]
AISPEYEGDNDYDISIAPLVSFHYRDLIFVDNNHIRVNILGSDTLIESENFKAGPSLSIDFGRNESNSVDLTGLGDVGTSVELGGFVSYQQGPTRARIRVRQDVASGHNGMEIIGDFRILFYNSEKTTIVTTIKGTWVNETYMDSFFGVTPFQSTQSALPAFDSGSGFKDLGANITMSYLFNDKWSFAGNVGYKQLLGDAKNSPLVQLRGSKNQFVGAAFAVYTW